MKIKRAYKAKDSDMYDAGMSAMNFFEKHLADFTTHDPSLNTSYLNNWKAALNELMKHLPVKGQEGVVFEDSFLIEDADKTLKLCRTKYMEVKYYAGKAFPDNKELLKEFGAGNYSKVQFSRLRMVPFMKTLHGVATKYKTELIAQNYLQPSIDHILTLALQLETDTQEQQLKKKERPTETRKRIEAFNTFYGFGQQVAEAARFVFRDNDVYRNQFLLAKRHHPKVTKHWLAVSATGVRKIALPKLLKKFSVTLTNQSKETIDYWKADNINEAPAEKKQLTGGEVISLTAEYPAKKFLVVQNATTKPTRLMLVKEKKG